MVFPLRRSSCSSSSSTATTSQACSSGFCPASALRSSLSGADSYASVVESAHLQKEVSSSRTQDVKSERSQPEANHLFTSKLSAGPGLEQTPSPVKATEPKTLSSAGPGAIHPFSRGQGKIQPSHHTPLDPSLHAVSAPEPPSREKSKPFSVQEQELRVLGKTTMTAASFIDVIITRQISCDKGMPDRSSLNNGANGDGKRLEGVLGRLSASGGLPTCTRRHYQRPFPFRNHIFF